MPKKHHIEVESRELAISNVEKVYFPASGFTKGQVISFYSEIAEVILPHLRDRPMNVVDALRLMDGDFVLDGEIVVLDEQGRPSFQLLQKKAK
jgi:DNA primase